MAEKHFSRLVISLVSLESGQDRFTGSENIFRILGYFPKERRRQVEIREKLQDLMKVIDGTFIEVAELLHGVYHTEVYTNWNYRSFEEYCRLDLGLNYRKALYLVTIWQFIRECHIPIEDARAVGWSKIVR
jgi:hypothetical protein